MREVRGEGVGACVTRLESDSELGFGSMAILLCIMVKINGHYIGFVSEQYFAFPCKSSSIYMNIKFSYFEGCGNG